MITLQEKKPVCCSLIEYAVCNNCTVDSSQQQWAAISYKTTVDQTECGHVLSSVHNKKQTHNKFCMLFLMLTSAQWESVSPPTQAAASERWGWI